MNSYIVHVFHYTYFAVISAIIFKRFLLIDLLHCVQFFIKYNILILSHNYVTMLETSLKVISLVIFM